jgi:hypothetical protein
LVKFVITIHFQMKKSLLQLLFLISTTLLMSCSKNEEITELPPEPKYKIASDYIKVSNEFKSALRHLPIEFKIEDYSLNLLNITYSNRSTQEFTFDGGTGIYIYAWDITGIPVSFSINYKFNKSGNEYSFKIKSLSENRFTSSSIFYSSFYAELEFKINGKLISEKKTYKF